jgi:hypothetical protein
MYQRRTENVVQHHADQAAGARPDHGLYKLRNVPASKQRRDEIKTARVQHGEERHQQRQQQVRRELPGVGKGQRRRGEQRLPAKEKAKRAIGHHAGQAGGQDHFRFELRRGVHDLGREECAGQRSAKNGRHASTHSRGEQYAAIGQAKSQQFAQE